MPNQFLSLDQIQEFLKLEIPDPQNRFVIRYGPYAPDGVARGFRGFRDTNLIAAYLEGLTRGFDGLQAIFPTVVPAFPIRVLVYHLPDYELSRSDSATTHATKRGMTILLSNRSHEVSKWSRFDRARSDAVHELCHVFQSTTPDRLPSDDLARSLWAWINESAAVFSANHVFPGGAEGVYFCQDWLDNPDVSLDHVSQQYSSGMFIRWYARKYGVAGVGAIWAESQIMEGPFDVIERKDNCKIGDLFREYARDGYFLRDPASGCYFPSLYSLWGTREVRETFVLPSDIGSEPSYYIDHLSAHYFRVNLSPGAGMIAVGLSHDGTAPELAAQIAIVRRDLRRGPSIEFRRDEISGNLVAAIPADTEGDADHLVVTVTNGSRSQDRLKFTLKFRMIST